MTIRYDPRDVRVFVVGVEILGVRDVTFTTTSDEDCVWNSEPTAPRKNRAERRAERRRRLR